MEWIFYSLPIATFATMTIRWWFYDRYPNMRSVYAQWDIPDDLPPVEVGYIVDKKIHRRDLSGLVVDLALRGYISMDETMIPMKIDSRIDFKFVRSPDTSQHQLLPYEKLFLQALFQQGNTVFLSGFGAEFAHQMDAVKNEIVRHVKAKKYFSAKRWQVYASAILSIIFACAILWAFNENATQDLRLEVGSIFPSSLIVTGFLILTYKRTQKGQVVHENIRGLQKYLESAEGRRIASIDELEVSFDGAKYLPYAMALGVEGKWSETFDYMFNEKARYIRSKSDNDQVENLHKMELFIDELKSHIKEK